jgi:branched-chain amino acid transport system substrate-binding protein
MERAMKKAVIRAAMIGAMFAVSAVRAEGICDGTVKIGVLTDMNGVFSDLAGAGAITAGQMVIDDVVEKEKPSFKVELVSADHQCRDVIN